MRSRVGMMVMKEVRRKQKARTKPSVVSPRIRRQLKRRVGEKGEPRVRVVKRRRRRAVRYCLEEDISLVPVLAAVYGVAV